MYMDGDKAIFKSARYQRAYDFELACGNNEIGSVVHFLEEQPHFDPNLIIGGYVSKVNGLHAACNNNHVEVVKKLLRSPRIDPTVCDDHNRTPLFFACHNRSKEVVAELVKDPRILVNKPNNDGITPLYIAVINNDIDIVRILIASGRDLDLGSEGSGSEGTDVIECARFRPNQDMYTELCAYKFSKCVVTESVEEVSADDCMGGL